MYRRDIWYLYWFYVKYITYKIPSSQINSHLSGGGGGSEAENRNLTEEKMNIKLNIEILIEELRTTILWGNVCFIFCICRNFIFKTNDIACIIRNAPLQLLPDQGRRIFRRMSLIQLFIVFVLDIQRKITAVQDSVPGSLLHP